jgi:hypothetical protein
MIRAAERWRGLPVTAFERRRLEAVQGELDTEYQTRIWPPAGRTPAEDYRPSAALTVAMLLAKLPLSWARRGTT